MRQLIYKKRFLKNFKKSTKKNQAKIIVTLEIFEETPSAPLLRRHKLKGKFLGKETIDVTGNLRILFCEQTGEVYDIIDVGTHGYFYD